VKSLDFRLWRSDKRGDARTSALAAEHAMSDGTAANPGLHSNGAHVCLGAISRHQKAMICNTIINRLTSAQRCQNLLK
jgi:hypothetical protein